MRDFRARLKRLKVSLERAEVNIPDEAFKLFFLVKLSNWKEIKTFKPDTFEEIFDTALDLEGKNKEAKGLYLESTDKKDDRKCYGCNEVGHMQRDCPRKCNH